MAQIINTETTEAPRPWSFITLTQGNPVTVLGVKHSTLRRKEVRLIDSKGFAIRMTEPNAKLIIEAIAHWDSCSV